MKWPTRRLGELAEFRNGLNFSAADRGGDLPVVGVGDFGRTVLRGSEGLETIRRPRELAADALLKTGDLLFVRSNGNPDLVGRCMLVEALDAPTSHSGFTIRARVASSSLDPRWVACYFESGMARRSLGLGASGTNISNLSQMILADVEIPLPPLEVQQLNLSLAARFDDRGGHLAQLIAAKRTQKLGLLQAFLGPAVIPVQDGGAGARRSLSELLTESREPSSTGTHARKLTIKLYGRGVLPKIEHRAGSPHTQYYRRRAGQFIYSKLDFLNGAFGIVPLELDGYETTLDLPAFDLSPEVDAEWLLQLFSWRGFYKRHVGLAHGGRKARRVNPAALLELEIGLPSVERQRRVAGALAALDREIDLLNELWRQHEAQRRGILQRLLKGDLVVAAPQVSEPEPAHA